jgi:hypothetical protein
MDPLRKRHQATRRSRCICAFRRRWSNLHAPRRHLAATRMGSSRSPGRHSTRPCRNTCGSPRQQCTYRRGCHMACCRSPSDGHNPGHRSSRCHICICGSPRSRCKCRAHHTGCRRNQLGGRTSRRSSLNRSRSERPQSPASSTSRAALRRRMGLGCSTRQMFCSGTRMPCLRTSSPQGRLCMSLPRCQSTFLRRRTRRIGTLHSSRSQLSTSAEHLHGSVLGHRGSNTPRHTHGSCS